MSCPIYVLLSLLSARLRWLTVNDALCRRKKKGPASGPVDTGISKKKTSGGWKRKFSRRSAEYLGNHGFSRVAQWTCHVENLPRVSSCLEVRYSPDLSRFGYVEFSLR
ncbi:hypothetical protein BJY01DRAFT_202786 [Aspergillus pseudoustus]|uniref:Secreted protein n=1 Tax=Aspergillus pseudoustus TaxID=1810923 RepID=A0ABR4KXV1_9EURO